MKKTNKVFCISLTVNVFLSLIKIIFGIIGKSAALVADGIHSFSDMLTDIIAIFGNHLSNKPADDMHPYGHGKIEYFTSIVIGVIIIFFGLGIIYNGVDRKIIIPSLMVISVSLGTIIAKLFLSRYITRKGLEYNNNILIASGRESGTDVISSILVLVSVVLMQLSNQYSFLKYADKITCILVGIFIINVGFNILKENFNSILGERVDDEEYLNSLKEIIIKNTQIKEIDSLIVLKYGQYYKLIGEVSLDMNLTLLKAHDVVEKLEKKLKKYDKRIKYIIIHMNPFKIEQKK